MKKRIICMALITVLVLSMGSVALAITVFGYQTSGSCKKAYITTGYLWKADSQTWSSFVIRPTTLSYSGGSGTYPYAVAEPYSSLLGKACAAKRKVYLNTSYTYTPNSDGASAEKVNFKIYNAYYYYSAMTTTTLTFAANCNGGV